MQVSEGLIELFLFEGSNVVGFLLWSGLCGSVGLFGKFVVDFGELLGEGMGGERVAEFFTVSFEPYAEDQEEAYEIELDCNLESFHLLLVLWPDKPSNWIKQRCQKQCKQKLKLDRMPPPN